MSISAGRAREAGHRPLHVRGARYRHVGELGCSPAGRHRLLLTADSSLYLRHAPGWRSRAALAALGAGTAVRAAAGAVTASPNAATWSTLWRERDSWQGGWERMRRARWPRAQAVGRASEVSWAEQALAQHRGYEAPALLVLRQLGKPELGEQLTQVILDRVDRQRYLARDLWVPRRR